MDPDRCTVLVPVSSPAASRSGRPSGKTRLSGGLDPAERAALIGAMLADVVAAIRAAGVRRLVVTARGPEGAAAAAALGVDVLLDPPHVGSLDGAIAVAATRLPPSDGLLVVTADLPRLTAADVARVLEADGHVVVAPTDDGGTGALLRRPPTAIATAYGPGSAGAHVRLGRTAGLITTVVEPPGFRHDVDTWDDLRRLRELGAGPATTAFLRRVADRLEAAG